MMTPPEPAKLRILVADDNPDSAASLSLLLSILGYETRATHDGMEAFEAATEFRPDVALLDIGMPRLNGFDLARRLRGETWGRNIVLIAVTGWGQTEDRQKTLEAGFDHHLVKPVDPTALTKLLATVAKTGAS
jgi:CheY-like chemotaxis protein